MIVRGLRRPLAIAAVFGIMTAVSSMAHASLLIEYEGTVTSGTAGSFGPTSTAPSGLTVGDFSITMTATPIAPGSLTTNTIDVNNSGSQTETIQLAVSGTGFNLGTGTVLYGNAASGTTTSGDGQTVTLQGYTDQGNSFFSLTNTTGPQAGTAGSGSPTTFDFGSNAALESTFAATGAFSITQVFTITLAAGANADLTLSTPTELLVASAPEPSTMSMALAGLPILLGYYGLRRRAKA